jgi:hypothetical protein
MTKIFLILEEFYRFITNNNYLETKNELFVHQSMFLPFLDPLTGNKNFLP